MWPTLPFSSRTPSEAAPFSPNVDWPVLRVVVDPQTNVQADIRRHFDLLRESDGSIRILRRVDGGDLKEVGDYEVIPPGPETGGEYAGVREYRAGGVAFLGVPSARNNIAAASNWASHYGFDPHDASARQLDAEAARSLDAHIYMTDNAYLLHRPSSYRAASVPETMAVVGLHQRLRNHVILGEGIKGLFSTWQAQMIQSNALLLGSARAFSEAGSGLPGQAVRLVGAACQRLEKAIAARDKLLLSSTQQIRTFGADAPEDSVERIAIALQGMFDALARALNACLAVPVDVQSVSWHRTDFLRAVPAASRRAAKESRFAALRAVIGELRNTVHHEPVGRAASESNGRVERLVTLPSTSAERFLRGASSLGNDDKWVAFNIEPYGLALRPIALCDDVILEAVAAGNRLLESFPWSAESESLAHPARASDWHRYPPYAAINRLLYGL